MDTRTTWDESHFDQMSWHDNHVHALRIREGDDLGGQLELDLDYILEWLQPDKPTLPFRFRVAPATLTFRDVYDLQIEIDYKTVGAALVPFSIAEIERVPRSDTVLSHWAIRLNWPQGHVSFLAAGFCQTLRAPGIITESQALTTDQRTALGA